MKRESVITERYGERFVPCVDDVRVCGKQGVALKLCHLINTVALDMNIQVREARPELWWRWQMLLSNLRDVYFYSIGQNNSSDADTYKLDVLGSVCPEIEGYVDAWVIEYNQDPFSYTNIDQLKNAVYSVGGRIGVQFNYDVVACE